MDESLAGFYYHISGEVYLDEDLRTTTIKFESMFFTESVIINYSEMRKERFNFLFPDKNDSWEFRINSMSFLYQLDKDGKIVN